MDHRAERPRLDGMIAVLLAAGTLLVYVRTLAPGLMSILDTPGFQFVGRVLGTLHNPGYPGYVLLTHLWSYLPIGSLAYRMNLFSAVAGAVATAGMFVLLRLIGVRRTLSAAAAAAMAFGSIFWSQAVIAEVYMLNAATVLWTLAAIVGWRRTSRPWMFFAAVALFALGLGNHTTIVLLAPGLALYALIVDRRFALRGRTVLLVALIVAAGLAQYGLILLRTHTPGAYLESRAATLPELVDVMRGAQFEHALFSFTARKVITERVGMVAGSFVVPELTWPVLILAAGGFIRLLRHRMPEGVLLVSEAIAVATFVLNYDAADLHVFTIPLLIVLWAGAAVGAEALLGVVPRAAVAAIVGLAAIFPFWQLNRNYAASDLSRDTIAMRSMDALFAALPDRSFILRQDFVVDRMLMYKLVGENAAGSRRIQAHFVEPADAAAIHASGHHVFAFPETARSLRFDGVNVHHAPFATYPWSLQEFLSEVPDGWVIGVAAPALLAPGLSHAVGPALGDFTSGELPPGLDRAAITVIGVKGRPREGQLRTEGRSSVSVEKGALRVSADATSAVVHIREREVVRTEDGAVVVVGPTAERLQTVSVAAPQTGFRIRSLPGPFSVFEVGGMMPSTAISTGWTPVAIPSGLVVFRVPANADVTIRFPRRHECAIRVVQQSSDALAVRVERVTSGETAKDGAGHPAPTEQLTLAAPPGSGTVSAVVATGCVTSAQAFSTVATATAHVMSADGLLEVPHRLGETLLMARTPQAWLLGRGWSDARSDAGGAFRWIEGGGATLLLPLRRGEHTRLRMQVFADARAEGRPLRVSLDNVHLEPRPLAEGWNWYEWELPPHARGPGVRSAAIHAPFENSGAIAVSQIELLGTVALPND